MGSYLSEPVTEKVSTDKSNDKLSYGASSMQGWRVSQEDSHNAILDYDESTAFFSVFDGHGGHEVAQYCSQKLPQFIKETDAYKNGDIEQALIEGFLGFDATIATPEVVAVLKEIANEKEDDESDEEENYHNLYEEASMPIEKVIEKYTNLVNPTLSSLKKGEKLPKSPVISSKKDRSVVSASSSSGEVDSCSIDAQQGCSSSSNSNEAEAGCSGTSKPEPDSSSSTNGDLNDNNEKPEDTIETMLISNGPIPEVKVTGAVDSLTPEADTNTPTGSSENEVSESKKQDVKVGDVDGESLKDDDNKDGVSSSVNGDIDSIKGKGKSPMKKHSPKTPPKTERPKRNAAQLYKKLLDFKSESDEEDTEDDDDKTFMEPEVSSDEEEEEADGSGDSSDADGDDEDEGEEEEDAVDEDDQHELEFARNIKEEPGSDSGCTAVVAVIKGRELYVANAGDSRCVICRDGKAVEMSFDHKPEDSPERARILKAGGKVTADGRVNGGLNLSRAIGDHAYKENKDLSDKEQMITALPDVKKLTLNPGEDEFMVLACDGIWNYMSSQEVVNFVKTRIDKTDTISHICEEMFDHCLAPNTMGDGTGCDNMTCIIVKFNSSLKKRPMSPESSNSAELEAKRAKTEDPQSVESSS